MMQEKQGVIEPGRTPPENEQQKTASQLSSHPTQRAADAVKDGWKTAEKKEPPK
jgi:hypothetical protein